MLAYKRQRIGIIIPKTAVRGLRLFAQTRET